MDGRPQSMISTCNIESFRFRKNRHEQVGMWSLTRKTQRRIAVKTVNDGELS